MKKTDVEKVKNKNNKDTSPSSYMAEALSMELDFQYKQFPLVNSNNVIFRDYLDHSANVLLQCLLAAKKS